MPTGIEWTMGDDGTSGETWNPTDGCKVCSPGCANCYAMRFAGRFAKPGERYHGLVTIGKNKRAIWTGKGRLDAGKLAKPLRWRKPRRIFVNSMSDLFYEEFTNEEIAAVVGVMAACPQHTFQVLTKRARRMREWFEWAGRLNLDDIRMAARREVRAEAVYIADAVRRGTTWPLPNVWLGVSVENQDAADERIPELLATPAAVRFLSCEPLLGPVDLRRVRPSPMPIDALTGRWAVPHQQGNQEPRVHWVIAGCESGPGARPAKVDWYRSLRDQCKAAAVPFFLKQAKTALEDSRGVFGYPSNCGARFVLHGGPGSKRKARGVLGLPYLDGVQHREFPNTKEMTP